MDRAEPLIDRASPEDVTTLVTDVGAAPMQVGAVLFLDAVPNFDRALIERTLAERLASIPRMRQRLVMVPFGCGRPIWVDDDTFDIRRHLRVVSCPSPGDRDAALELAGEVVTTRLDRSRPLWSATIVTDLTGGQLALVVVFHHALADGIGGLAMLANLVDGPAVSAESPWSPRPAPRRCALAADAARSRLAGVRRLPATVRRAHRSFRAFRSRVPTRATPCSLNRPTGPRRRLGLVQVNLQPIIDVAHAQGATVNDVLLAGITAALRDLLGRRSESLDRVVVSIPVAGRRETTVTELGNRVSAVPVELPAGGAPFARLREVARITRDAKQASSVESAEVLLGPVFRLLARVGRFGWFIDRQRMVHTFVTNLRGPTDRMQLLGAPITDVMAVAVVPGNVTASFAVLSYAGTLSVTIVADPDTCPDLDVLQRSLELRLAELVTSTAEQVASESAER